MKRALKIIGWFLGALVMVALLIELLVCTILFQPEHLTPLVNKVADSLITCHHEMGSVQLTYFKTFPYFTLSISDVTVVNPMQGALDDTLLVAPCVKANVNLLELIRHKNLIIREIQATDLKAYIFIDSLGRSNLDILRLPHSTHEPDTTNTPFLIHSIALEKLKLSTRSLAFDSQHDSIRASLGHTTVNGQIGSWTDICLDMKSNDVCVQVGDICYADSTDVTIHLPLSIDMDSMLFDINMATVSVSDLTVLLDGSICLQDKPKIDMSLSLKDWNGQQVITLLPTPIADPIRAIRLNWKKTIVSLTADTQFDFHDKTSFTAVRSMTALVNKSRVSASGHIRNPLQHMLFDLTLDADVRLKDLSGFLPDNMDLTGQAKGDIHLKMALEDMIAQRWEKGKLESVLKVQQIRYQQDSLTAYLPQADITLTMPNQHAQRSFMRADIQLQRLEANQYGRWNAQLPQSRLHLESSNFFKDTILDAEGQIQSSDTWYANYDTITASIQHPHLNVIAKYDKHDHVLRFVSPVLTANAINTNIGKGLWIKTDALRLGGTALYHPGSDKFLLTWNPIVMMDLTNGYINMASFDCPIEIPHIQLNYSNMVMFIRDSHIRLGNSDFSLYGKVKRIGRWLRHQAILEGELEFVSDYADVNQLLDLFSADRGSQETTAADTIPSGKDTIPSSEEPFLVPLDVDLSLTTQINTADVFNQHLQQVGGTLYVRNGNVVLEQMGFTCRAAKLQLTAMYKSPRRNHLYVGLDYHMLDVDIAELIHIVPDLDTLVPMLQSFKGKAEFHLAGETYMNAHYEPKMSTIRGACSLFGKDLVVIDSETFSQISKQLLFDKKTENRVDSISVELSVYKNVVDVYPFCVQMDKYLVALGGHHNLNMTFDYDINVLKPIYLGVNVSGTTDNLNIHLAPCKFAKNFHPIFYRKVDTQTMELRELIRNSMRQNIKIQ